MKREILCRSTGDGMVIATRKEGVVLTFKGVTNETTIRLHPVAARRLAVNLNAAADEVEANQQRDSTPAAQPARSVPCQVCQCALGDEKTGLCPRCQSADDLRRRDQP